MCWFAEFVFVYAPKSAMARKVCGPGPGSRLHCSWKQFHESWVAGACKWIPFHGRCCPIVTRHFRVTECCAVARTISHHQRQVKCVPVILWHYFLQCPSYPGLSSQDSNLTMWLGRSLLVYSTDNIFTMNVSCLFSHELICRLQPSLIDSVWHHWGRACSFNCMNIIIKG